MLSSPGVPLFQYDRRLDIVVHGKIYQVSKDAREVATCAQWNDHVIRSPFLRA